MDKRWSSNGGRAESERRYSGNKKSMELGTPHSSVRALLLLFFILCSFSFLSRSYSVNLEVHSVHSHAVAEA